MIALLNLSVLGFSFIVFHDKAKRTQQGNLLGGEEAPARIFGTFSPTVIFLNLILLYRLNIQVSLPLSNIFLLSSCRQMFSLGHCPIYPPVPVPIPSKYSACIQDKFWVMSYFECRFNRRFWRLRNCKICPNLGNGGEGR